MSSRKSVFSRALERLWKARIAAWLWGRKKEVAPQGDPGTILGAHGYPPGRYEPIYTDAPALRGNVVLATLQLMAWLFFHPSAWRNHVARVDPSLRPDFLQILDHGDH